MDNELKLFHAILISALMWALPAAAELREMSQADLRAAVNANRALPSQSVMAGVENYTGGEVLEIRAFEVDGAVTFRVLFRQDGGALAAMMIDGSNGRAVSPQSALGQSITSYMDAQVTRNSASLLGQANRGNGQNNRGGNGNGNSGGNGNGNSGGNGGGNGGGNSGGKGNSGRN